MDLKTFTLHEFDSSILFFSRIEMDFTELMNTEIDYMNDIYNWLFVVPLGEKVADYFLLNLSCALAGNLMKRFFFGLGSGNSGKSTLVKAYSSSLEN